MCGGGRGAHLDRAAALCGEPRNERAHLTRPTHNRLRASVWLGASLQRAEARQVCTGDGGGDASGLYGAGGGGGTRPVCTGGDLDASVVLAALEQHAHADRVRAVVPGVTVCRAPWGGYRPLSAPRGPVGATICRVLTVD